MLDFLSNLEITIPANQIIFLLVITTVFMLFGHFKTALTSDFIFILYWLCQSQTLSTVDLPFNKVIPLIAGNYTVITTVIFFGIALLIFYEIFE